LPVTSWPTITTIGRGSYTVEAFGGASPRAMISQITVLRRIAGDA
jgi:hypothetical protein